MILTGHYCADIDNICDLSGFDIKYGTTMFGLLNAANKLGLPAVPMKLTVKQLKREKSKGIVFVDDNHFSYFHGFKGDMVILQDPPGRHYVQHIDVFSDRWSGDVLLISKKQARRNKSGVKSILASLKGPRLSMHTRKHDFGAIYAGDTLRCVFPLINSGSDILQVSARSSCSCAELSVSKKELAPGEQSEIIVAIAAKSQENMLNQEITIRTNDILNKLVTLSLVASVKSPIRVFPEKLWLGDIVNKQKVSYDVLMVSQGNNSVEIMKIEHPEWISVELLPVRNGKMKVIPLQVTVFSNEMRGKIKECLTIHTNDSENMRFEIPIIGRFVNNMDSLSSTAL